MRRPAAPKAHSTAARRAEGSPVNHLACIAFVRQRCARAARSASLKRPVLRTSSPAMLGRVARRRTHFAHCVRSVQTAATSQMTKRAARAATRPGLAGRPGPVALLLARHKQSTGLFVSGARLLGASEARCSLHAHAFAGTLLVFGPHANQSARRGSRYPAGAISVATRSTAPGLARKCALRQPSRRSCLNAESAANAVSSAARPWRAHRSAVVAKRRPPQVEPLPGTGCPDARTPQRCSAETEVCPPRTLRRSP